MLNNHMAYDYEEYVKQKIQLIVIIEMKEMHMVGLTKIKGLWIEISSR